MTWDTDFAHTDAHGWVSATSNAAAAQQESRAWRMRMRISVQKIGDGAKV